MDTSMNYLKINQASGRHRTIERANHHHLSIWDWANWSLQHEENLGKLGSEFLTHWSIVGKMNRRFFDALGRKKLMWEHFRARFNIYQSLKWLSTHHKILHMLKILTVIWMRANLVPKWFCFLSSFSFYLNYKWRTGNGSV